MRPALVLGANLVVGTAALGYVLHRFGAPAVELLARPPELRLLVALPAMVTAALAGYAMRWRILLAGLGVRRGLGRLTAYRAAGQSLSSLIPSAKLGGEPLRAVLLVADQVPGGDAASFGSGNVNPPLLPAGLPVVGPTGNPEPAAAAALAA